MNFTDKEVREFARVIMNGGHLAISMRHGKTALKNRIKEAIGELRVDGLVD